MATSMKQTLAVLLVAVAFGPRLAAAQEPLVGVDGCAILALLVYAEVTSTDKRHSRGPGGTFAYPYGDEITICNQTARTVTRAFSKSMQQMNIYVAWGPYDPGNGDYCNSQYLDQCVPRGNPAVPSMSDEELAFVRRSWRAIRGAIEPTLSHGLQGDASRFANRDLALDLRHSLRRRTTSPR